MPVPSYHTTCTRKELITRDVYELSFTKPEGFTFIPGKFVLFDIPLIENEKDIQTRALSIASRPDEEELLFLVKLVPGGRLSRWIVEVLKEGTEVRIQGPFGNFLVDRKTMKEYLFLATGTGLAPFLPQIEQILKEGDTRTIDLIFGVRSPEDLFWIDRFTALEATYPHFHFHIALSDKEKTDHPHFCGRIQELLHAKQWELSQKNVYVCGSPGMIKDIKELCLTSWNVPKADLHFEAYI